MAPRIFTPDAPDATPGKTISRATFYFENPAGGAPIVIAKPASPETKRLDFVTPPLSGVEADRDYAVSVRLIDGQGKELERIDKKFRSQLDQSRLPDAPLTIGPGYAPNPQNAPDAAKP